MRTCTGRANSTLIQIVNDYRRCDTTFSLKKDTELWVRGRSIASEFKLNINLKYKFKIDHEARGPGLNPAPRVT